MIRFATTSGVSAPAVPSIVLVISGFVFSSSSNPGVNMFAGKEHEISMSYRIHSSRRVSASILNAAFAGAYPAYPGITVNDMSEDTNEMCRLGEFGGRGERIMAFKAACISDM